MENKFREVSIFDIIFSLESQSKHPAAVALLNYARKQGGVQKSVEHFLETPGRGVRGEVNGLPCEINRDGLFIKNVNVAKFNFTDVVRPDSKFIVAKLKSRGLTIKMLSGDKDLTTNSVALQLELAPGYTYSGLSPESKNRIVRETPLAMMVGDGANDAIALTSAHVSVAVLGAMDISLRAADIYLAVPGLSSLDKVMTLANESMKVIKRNLILSLLYNSVSVFAAFQGWIGPLTAAIIMPLSSLTVLFSTIYGTKKLRNLWN
jgi:Cu2+-exporting ATPase/Cu+-exporting ATPase